MHDSRVAIQADLVLEPKRVLGLPGSWQGPEEPGGRHGEHPPPGPLPHSPLKPFQTELDQNIVDGARSLLTYEYARKSETVMAAVRAPDFAHTPCTG